MNEKIDGMHKRHDPAGNPKAVIPYQSPRELSRKRASGALPVVRLKTSKYHPGARGYFFPQLIRWGDLSAMQSIMQYCTGHYAKLL
ncbi:MAG: hypothetical protein V3S64_02050 [bacterium]